jgi:WD40 repeat protein
VVWGGLGSAEAAAQAKQNAQPPEKVVDLTSYLKPASQIYYAQFSRDGGRLAFLDLQRRLCLVDATNGELLTRWGERGRSEFIPIGGTDAAIVSPDGTRVAARTVRKVGSGKEDFEVLDAKDFSKPLVVLNIPGSKFIWGNSHRTDISADNKFLLTTNNQETRLFSLADGKQIGEYPKAATRLNFVYDVRFLPDGKRFVVAEASGGLMVRERESGKVVWNILPKGNNYFHQPACSPDGKIVAACVGDSQGMVLHLFNADSGKLVMTRPFPIAASSSGFPVKKVIFSPDGKSVATNFFQNGDGVQVMDLATGKITARVSGDRDDLVYDFAFSADGTRLAAWIPRSHKVLWWKLK